MERGNVANERPWLILTLRRTGGTSLTTFLSTISTFPRIEHEPFNSERIFGGITRAFQETSDIERMTAEVRTALERRPNIKHCVEVVPLEITRAIIDTCHALGYHFIVLTRRDESRRLGSLLLAQATGAWGPKEAKEIYPQIISGAVKPAPIPLDKVRGRVTQDYYSIGRTLSLLRNRRIDPSWYLFEELYFGDESIATQARTIAANLGVDISMDDPRLQAFAQNESQRSSSIGPYIPNFDKAEALLRHLCAS
ncbi:hypothetical protein [Paracoccus aestuariivivens]|uniref:Sulphotransferase Stf0 domain-containing protein n=1 Tax=Paracoccus aestuariivivens TaxID=1820333 RepID=A0A6L6JHR6_9RHOB|nr:hypothetical protein [Paracoccus aestuariivivens]MTH80097.1 hypothetical protein [Paracoccus aestuariivivens]